MTTRQFKNPVPSMVGVPEAPPRYAADYAGDVAEEAWRIGYADSVNGDKMQNGLPDNSRQMEYTEPDLRTAYCVGFASGNVRLFQ
jgi:hypothetical protein